MQAANVKVKNHFLFSGTKTRTLPFEVSASGAVYLGNTENFTVEIAPNNLAEITFPGSEVFAADLNPTLSASSLLADLNGGAGISAGQFSITDRSGNTGTVSVTSGMSMANLINAINSAGVNITASFNNDSNGIILTDTSSVITGALQVTDLSGGTTALELGIRGKQDGNLQGADLNQRMTSATLVSQLVGGDGLILEDISIINGAASGTISFSSANTVGDVLNAINGAGLNVTTRINSAGNALSVTSNDPSTVAVVNESRAILGAVFRHVESTKTIHDQDIVDMTQQLADLEDSDLIQAASDMAALELALQVTLDTTARILQPSLLDFLR